VNSEPPPFLPRAALRLGFLGLIPLAVCGLVSLSQYHDTAHLGAVAFALYAAVLLSFLGGVRCGIEIMRDPRAPNPVRLLFSALPGLLGWGLALFVVLTPGAFVRGAVYVGSSQRARCGRAGMVSAVAPSADRRGDDRVLDDPAGERAAAVLTTVRRVALRQAQGDANSDSGDISSVSLTLSKAGS
jgi:hypothetical protein